MYTYNTYNGVNFMESSFLGSILRLICEKQKYRAPHNLRGHTICSAGKPKLQSVSHVSPTFALLLLHNCNT